MKKNYSQYGLPKIVKFCKKCVISNQRPNSVVEFKNKNNQKKGIFFNTEGVCQACEYSELKSNINWELREKNLLKLLSKYRKNNGYDCIVPGSGGKDSAFTAHILKYKYGMNPLTVTWAPHLYTNIGWENFTNWMHKGGLDNILFTPNGKLHRYLTKLAFVNLLHPFQPFIIGQRMIGPKIAEKFNIPLVIYGENQAEYGNKIEENKNPLMDVSFFSSDNEKNLTFGGLKLKEILKKTDFKINDFDPYLPLNFKTIKKNKIKVAYLGYFLKWDPQECFYYASKNTGFVPNTERTEGSYSKYSSIDDKIDPFHYYTTYIKFGIGRATYDASQEIRNNKIDREEGIGLVKTYDHEFPEKYFKDFLNYIDVSKDKFFQITSNFRSPHLWSKSKNKWKLKSTVY
ncbi:N-acetyl sugar amidotransferase [Candidatus Pelagibacter sp.]|uniref:N-acetyl sugar amidotransferase n=1 Tax=Candidatus Pelagibacter sp. TaxID=2024849 RepID=UPI003F843C6F